MDPKNGFAPLFEAQLELCEPNLVFVPPLDPAAPESFTSVVEGLINDIVKMASLISRVALCHGTTSYEVLHYRLLTVASNSFVLINKVLHEYSFKYGPQLFVMIIALTDRTEGQKSTSHSSGVLFVKNKILFKYNTFSLQIDMENNEDIRELKREILGGVQSVMKEVPVIFNFF
jgi:hypothetical protein